MTIHHGTVTPLVPPAGRTTSTHPPVPLRASIQGTLALDLAPELDPPRRPRTRALSAVGPVADAPEEPGVPDDLRQTVESWAHRYCQAAVEIAGGDRPVSQLLRWTSARVYADLARRSQLVAQAGVRGGVTRSRTLVRPQVRSVRACFLADDVAEVGAHVRYGERSRAVAARFERRGQRWLCTALEFA